MMLTMRHEAVVVVDGPKFVKCAGDSVVRRRLYATDVSIDCDVQAQPVVDHVTVEWTQSPARNITLSAGRRDGHLLLLLKPTNTSVRRPTVSPSLKCVTTLPCEILMSEKQQQPETCTVINDKSQGSVAT